MKTRLTLLLFALIVSVSIAGEAIAIDVESIVGAWLFEEEDRDEEVIDSSGNGHDGIIFGPPEWDEGKFGSALKLGAGNYVRVPHSEDLALETYTVTMWLSTEDSGRWISMVAKAHDNPTRNYMAYIHIDTGKPAMSQGGGGAWHDLGAKTVVNDGEWYHLAISFDDDEDVGKIFVNGVKEDQYSVADAVPLSDADLVFASYTHAGGNGYVGLLDEIAIFNVALEEEEIKRVMQDGISALTSPVESKGKLSTTWGGIKSKH